jgi:cell division protein FtsI (penicillin-binding protein 3)
MRSADLGRSGLRLRVACAVLLGCFAALAVRAAQLSMFDDRGATRGDVQNLTTLTLAAARGLIVDRSGAELAVTVSAPSVYAIPAEIGNAEQTARAIARALGGNAASLQKRLERKAPFVYVKRWVSRKQADAVRSLGLPGVGVVPEPRRAYPNRELAGRLLGFANIDGEGVRGIEQQEDSWLRGKAQRIAVERDAHRQLLVTSGLDPRSAAGGDVALSLDATLQAESDAALGEVLAATGARRGTVVSMDPHTGDILALSELPGFDPNRFRATSYPATRSHAFLDAMEPGSVLKPFVVAAALQHGVVSKEDEVDCEEGFFRIRGKTLRDRRPFGVVDVAGVLRVSSNIGAAKIGFAVGPEAHFETLRRFGFGTPTGSGFPEESAGLLRSWRDWREVDHATISFGQGIGVTAVQLASATSALANGGLWRQPRLVTARREAGGAWQALEPATGRRAVRAEVADTVLRMMETVVSTEGTGRRAALEGVRVAGKTGTAQKLDAETGTYSTKSYLAWFAGVAPADDPRIVIVVMLDEPAGRAHSGGATAAPLFARIAASHLVRHGILTRPKLPLPRMASVQPDPDAPQETRQPEFALASNPSHPSTRGEEDPQPAVLIVTLDGRVLLPDLRGLSISEVKQVTTRVGLEVEMQGYGRVVSQDPAPGTILAGTTRRVSVRFAPRGEDG